MILLLWACGGSSELASQRAAVEAWTQGESVLDSDPSAAADAFARARAAQPDDVLLVAWHARALAGAGDLEGSAALLDEVLRSQPRFAEARYNRAAYLARLGRLDEAGPELARALDDGAARSREAMVDPDFVDHLEHPAFAFLPSEMLIVAVDAPTGSLFWGSEATVRLRVVGGMGAPATVSAAQLEGPIELVGAVEDVVESTEGPVRDLSWSFKVRGPGEAVLGPFTVTSGPWTSEVREVRFPTTAPPGKGLDADGPALELLLPRVVGEGIELPGSRLVGQVLDVKSLPGDRVEVNPRPARPPLRLELRDRSRPKWIVERYAVDRVDSVRVTRKGTVVLEWPE